MKFRFGDYVIYKTEYKCEIGRVTECREDSAFVCYHQGCTAASTPLEYLRLATSDEIANAPAGIGFHRFETYCPERDDEYCYMCQAKSAN